MKLRLHNTRLRWDLRPAVAGPTVRHLRAFVASLLRKELLPFKGGAHWDLVFRLDGRELPVDDPLPEGDAEVVVAARRVEGVWQVTKQPAFRYHDTLP